MLNLYVGIYIQMSVGIKQIYVVSIYKVRHMCVMLRTHVEQRADIQDEMRQQLKDILEQTESTKESHNALKLRVGDIERRLSDMQEQIEEGRHQIDNLAEEQTKLKEGQTEDRQDIQVLYKRQNNLSEEQTKLKEGQTEERQDINVLYEEQAKLKIDVDEVKGESKTGIPTEEGKNI